MTEAVQRRTELVGATLACACVVAFAAIDVATWRALLLCGASTSSFVAGALVRDRPRARQSLFAAGSALWFAALLMATRPWPGAYMAPPVVLLPLACTMATLLSGWRVGAVAFVAANLGLWGYFLSQPPEEPAETARRANLAGSLVSVAWFLFHHEKTFRSLLSRLIERKRSIEQRALLRDRLMREVARDLGATIAALGRKLADERPDLAGLQRARSDVERVLTHARDALGARSPAAPATDDDALVPAFMLRMARWLLAIGAFAAATTVLRVAVLGRGAQAQNVTAFVSDLVLLYALFRWPRARAAVVAAYTAIVLVAITSSLAHWSFTEPGPALMFLPALTYNAVQIGGAWAGVGLVLLQLGVFGFDALAGAASQPWGRLVLLDLALSAAGLGACWYLMEMRVKSTVRVLHERNEELKRLEAFRARLGGTLFHDVANPLAAIAMLLHVAKIRKDLRAEDVELLRRLQVRLETLLGAALSALETEGPIPRDRVKSTNVGEMFVEVAELFSFKLAEKGQNLRIDAPSQLRVMAVPELLRDSVVANLVSNAIKFSPLGATIVLHAAQRGDDVEIVVRDEGPGWPDDLVRKLAEGEPLGSALGTGGEQGMGLGLGLVAEHTRRMGGRLDLRRAESTGSEAAVTLLSA